jgi:L,D-peptidoglycan transpeptidase YkuD (ErfK/YbiS/YcfS/YnhG family)
LTIAVVTPAGYVAMEGQVYRAALGKGGVRADKQEGDGATPVGVLKLRRILYRADRLPAPVCAVPVEPIAPEDGWCDAPDSPRYNRPVRLPFDASAEELWRSDPLYDIVGILGWNDQPVVRGRGSAIFLHVARDDLAPTDGCVALRLPDLRALLAAGLDGLEVLPV